MKNIVIIGAGDFGKEVLWLIEDINKEKPTYHILGFLDDDEAKHGKNINGYTVLGGTSKVIDLNEAQEVCACIALQDGDVRKKIVERLKKFDKWETLIHPNVRISDKSQIGKGCILCAGDIVSVDTVVGDFCIFNFNVVIGHDCKVSSFVSIMSGSVICGNVKIEENCYLATNSSVVPGKTLRSGSKVGAGSVVIRNVKSGVTVMGVPAKRVEF